METACYATSQTNLKKYGFVKLQIDISSKYKS